MGHPKDERLYRDCVKLTFENRKLSLFSVLVISFVPLVMGWDGATRGVTLLFVAGLWLYTLGNFLTVRFVNVRSLGVAQARLWSIFFHVQLALLAVLLNGVLLYLDLHHVAGSMSVLLMLTAGFSAGAVGAFHPLKTAGPLFVATAILPQVVFFTLTRPDYGLLIGVVWIVFFGFMTAVSLNLYRKTAQSLTLSYELEAAKEVAERLAMTDTLTGLPNRRAFFESAPRLLAGSIRHRRAISLVMLDIDHFKHINDQHGHAVGDQVLRLVAHCLRKALRESDLVARLGGEEFVLLLTDVTLDRARETAERVREELRRITVAVDDTTMGISGSLGVADGNGEGDTIDHLLDRADQALYQAKQSGRNRTVVYQTSLV